MSEGGDLCFGRSCSRGILFTAWPFKMDLGQRLAFSLSRELLFNKFSMLVTWPPGQGAWAGHSQPSAPPPRGGTAVCLQTHRRCPTAGARRGRRRAVRPLGGGAAWTARPGGQAGCGVRAEGARPAAVGALCPTDRLCQTGSLALCTWGAWGRPGGRSWLRGEAEPGLEGRPPRGPRGREPTGPSQQRAMAFVLRATVSPPPMSAPRNVGGA